jgi:hypothetical protein
VPLLKKQNTSGAKTYVSHHPTSVADIALIPLMNLPGISPQNTGDLPEARTSHHRRSKPYHDLGILYKM